MLIPDIELKNISRYRAEQMGAAMLFVILFHVALDRGDPFYGLRRCGNVGVDIFLFLSGVGLWFAWSKNQDILHFYRRRLLRILPTWLVCATAFYLPDYLGPRKFSRSLVALIGDITINWDFWLHDELTFWYVPAIMLLYLLAPLYMKLISRHSEYRWTPVLMIVWCIMVQWVLPIHHAVGHLEIFWSRVPIFFIGINCGEMVRTERRIEGSAVWMLLLAFAMTFGTSLRFVGALSLEAYLIHIHFVLVYIEPHHLGYWPTFLATVAITLPIAWVLQWIVTKLPAMIMKRKKQ